MDISQSNCLNVFHASRIFSPLLSLALFYKLLFICVLMYLLIYWLLPAELQTCFSSFCLTLMAKSIADSTATTFLVSKETCSILPTLQQSFIEALKRDGNSGWFGTMCREDCLECQTRQTDPSQKWLTYFMCKKRTIRESYACLDPRDSKRILREQC